MALGVRAVAVPAVAVAARAGWARHAFFVLAATSVLMSSIDMSIVAVALPQLTTSLDAPLVWVSWTLTAYQLVQVIMMPVAGKLSDSFGRKKVYLFCLGMFTLGSLLCGLAQNVGWLIGARAIQAVGGGGLMPSAVGVISDHYRENRAQARGLFSSVMPIGGIIGPNVGGFILQHWTWREMFWINLPIGITLLVGATLLLKGEHGERQARHIDVQGLALYAASIGVLLVAMTSVGRDPSLVTSPLVWAAALGSIGLAVLFLRYIKHAKDPVMDYELVVRQPFLAANLYNLVFGAVVFGSSVFMPTYAVTHFGLPPFLSGTVMTPRSIVSISTSVLASFFILRTGYRVPMLVGLALISSTFILLGMGWTELTIGDVTLSGFWLMAVSLAFGGVGMGLAGPASNNAALDLAPDRAAAMTGVRGMFRLTGGILSVATIVLIVSFFPNEGDGLRMVFRFLPLALLPTVPLVFKIPEIVRAAHRRAS